MPKQYRIMVTMYDETDTEISSSTHEETYENDQQARAKFDQKDRAARDTGKGSG